MYITLQNLSLSYPNQTVFDDVSISFDKGTLQVLYGKSGCGKTTLLNILAGLKEIPYGKLIYNGQELRKDESLLEEGKLLYINSERNIIEALSVMDNLLFITSIRKDCLEALKKVGLEGYEKQKGYDLSEGEKKRVSLAMAFLSEKETLLLDEPTANLDEKNAKIVFDNLALLAKEKCVIVVSHDPRFFKDPSFIRYEIKDGKINLMENNREVEHEEE